MFATIGHTFELTKMSWRVLMKDRELLAFPLMSGVALLIVLGVFAAIGAATGTLDRLADMAASEQGEQQESMTVLDAVVGVALYFAVSFVVIFFNSALIAAALERLRGGDPTIGSGLAKASSHLPAIIGWAAIAATVGIILQVLRSRTEGTLGRIVLSIVGGVWAYLTFFVVPLLVAEGMGPVAAIKRSTSLFRNTWGRQVTASFGFGLIYLAAVLVAGIPAAIIFAINPIAGIVAGVVLVGLAVAIVQALEGIFKAALFQYATGEEPVDFDRATLSNAWNPA